MPRIALVHDHLLEFGGAERVLVALKRIIPDADVYTSLVNLENLGEHKNEIASWNITASWAQSIPGFRRLFSPLRPLWPLIWESFDFSEYDIVISSSGTMMCKGIITRPETRHICYLHHPPRNLYGYETAIEWQKYWPVRIYGHVVNHQLRIWDYLSSQRVDEFIANSHETLSRIRKFYRMDGNVIYPPVSIPVQTAKKLSQNKKHKTSENRQYYITVSRIARAKHIEVLIEAANSAGFLLKVIGSGRDLARLREMAGETVEFLDNVPDDQFDQLFAGARAFLFAARDEEFGIAPIEAMGRGVPVIAYESGGLKETIQPGENGYLYKELSPQSLLEQIKTLESLSIQHYQDLCTNARRHAEQYSFDRFSQQITDLIKVT